MDYYPSPALPLPPGSLAQNGAEFELVHHFCTVTVDTLSLREVSKRGATSRRLFSSPLATYLHVVPKSKITYLPTQEENISGKEKKGTLERTITYICISPNFIISKRHP